MGAQRQSSYVLWGTVTASPSLDLKVPQPHGGSADCHIQARAGARQVTDTRRQVASELRAWSGCGDLIFHGVLSIQRQTLKRFRIDLGGTKTTGRGCQMSGCRASRADRELCVPPALGTLGLPALGLTRGRPAQSPRRTQCTGPCQLWGQGPTLSLPGLQFPGQTPTYSYSIQPHPSQHH